MLAALVHIIDKLQGSRHDNLYTGNEWRNRLRIRFFLLSACPVFLILSSRHQNKPTWSQTASPTVCLCQSQFAQRHRPGSVFKHQSLSIWHGIYLCAQVLMRTEQCFCLVPLCPHHMAGTSARVQLHKARQRSRTPPQLAPRRGPQLSGIVWNLGPPMQGSLLLSHVSPLHGDSHQH
ncbi:hypothetical protein IF1G_06857 [Cordyceps javanica]|uniref:Uncharacterized protein n=1 Tax=Cordyceps javanica TaxID=43265 RepID=A0A545UZG1_9HYPO|nr:hypothetical protein IF1G_06857 [Cordyceps javanica]